MKNNKRNYIMNYLGATSKTRGGHYVGTMDEVAESVGIKTKDSVDEFSSHNKGKRPLTDEEIESDAQSKDYSDLYNLWLGGKR